VTAATHQGAPTPPPGRTAREIRAALLPEEVGEFDSAWRGALSRAAETLDLDEVYQVLDDWHSIALLTRADPTAHRRMLQAARRVLAGEAIPTVPRAEIDALIQERLGR
jgi:hypothetical protein